MELLQARKLLHNEETINKMKRPSTEWEKIFANDIFDKGLISKEQTHFNTKKRIQLKMGRGKKKWAEDLNWHFPKEDIQMANRHMKRCSTSSVIREIRIRTTVRYYFTTVRMAIIPNQEMTSVCEDVAKREPLCALSGDVNWHSHFRKQYRVSSKN